MSSFALAVGHNAQFSRGMFGPVAGSFGGAVTLVIIDNGTGGTSVQVPEEGSVTVQLDGYPETTLIDLPGENDIGLLYPPSLSSGSLTIGGTLTFDLGIVAYQGSGLITVVQDLRRGGTTVASDIRATVGPSTHSHTVVSADLSTPLTVRTTMTNGANVVVVDTDVTTLSPILQAGANGWFDFSDTGLMTLEVGGTRIAALADKSAAGNDLTQTEAVRRPFYGSYTINSRSAALMQNAELDMPAATMRSAFFVVSDVLGATANIAPILGTDYDDSGATHKHIFLRANGATDYDISVDGNDSRTGTVYVDTGDTGSGGDITLTGLTPNEREGTRLWYVVMDADVAGVDVIGALRGTINLLRNDTTLFGEVVLFPTTLTTVQANAIANDIASRWGLTWTDI